MDEVIGVIGLGYVGLPLALELSKNFKVIGFDVNQTRIEELSNGLDKSLEVTEEQIKNSPILFSHKEDELKVCTTYIVTVPTPVTKAKVPDLGFIHSASRIVGKVLEKGNLVVYESTVFPGCTEEECAPVLEHESGLTYNQDFFCGYSPERMNPGDPERTVRKIVKVISASKPEVLERMEKIYSTVVDAGLHRAPSILAAEAAKVIENAQRDINIAFVNELAIIFEKLGLDTREVLEVA